MNYYAIDRSGYISHHGILGMKWGVRRYQNKDGSLTAEGKRHKAVTTKTGERMYFSEPNIKKYKDGTGTISMKMFNDAHRKIGDMYLDDRGKGELNGNWVSIKPKYRGKGYGTAAVEEAINYGRSNSYKKMTLEVPGSSPDARHIYEKLGFKEVATISEDDVWDGLTAMELMLDPKTKGKQ